MDKSTEEFIDSFYAITGTTIGERRKNLFRLMNNTHNTINTKLLKPKTPLEENFKIEVLLRFNKFSELLDVLKIQNRTLTKKILKHDKLIDEVCTKINAKDLMIVLSEMPFSMKLKIVKRLGKRLKSTEQAEEYFEALLHNYGLYFAVQVLSCCSINLILKYTSEHTIELTPKQLLIMIRKYPSSIENILENLNLNMSKNKFDKKCKHIFKDLKNDLPLLLKLLKKYGIDYKLSSKATYRILKTQSDAFVGSRKFFGILNQQRVARSYPQFYYKILPESITEFTNNFDRYSEFLNHIKYKPKKLRIILDGFCKAYDSNLWDYPSLVSTGLIEMMTPDDRFKWMEKYSKPSNITEYDWISFFKVEESIPKLKELISWTSNIKTRLKLISSLVKTCRLNNDQDALLDVLNYTWKNHRRDHILVIKHFLSTLIDYYNLSKLEERHWNILNQFIQIFLLDCDFSWYLDNLKENYIHFCLDHNKPIEHLLADLFASNKSLNICQSNPNHEKTCLKVIMDIIRSSYNEEELVVKFIQCISYFQNWNRYHPKDKLPLLINRGIINYLKSNMVQNYLYEDIASDYILLYFEEAQELIYPLVNNGHCYRLHKISSWLLRNHPMVFLDHLEPLAKCMVRNKSISPYVKQVSRYYTHLGIPQKMSEICGDLIADKNDFACVILTAVETFPNISKYNQREFTVNDSNKAHRKVLKEILSNVHLNDIMHFFYDESYVKKYMNFHCDNLNESDVLRLLDVLNQRETSIRKHALLIALKKLNLNKIENILISLKNENDAEIKTSAFKGVFNMFLRNPQSSTWNLLNQWVEDLNINDMNVIKTLTKCKNVPREFYVRYFLLVWNIMNDYPIKKTFIEKRQCDVLRRVDQNVIMLLPTTSCEKIIEEHFLKSTKLSDFQKLILIFTSNYVLYKNQNFLKHLLEKQKTRFVDIKRNVQKYVLTRSMIFYFVQHLCSHFLNKNTKSSSLLKLFINFWTESIGPSQFYKEFLYLHFTLISIDCSTSEEKGNNIAQLIILLSEGNCFVLSEFKKCYNLFKQYFLKCDSKNTSAEETELQIIETLARKNDHVSCLYFAMNILPGKMLLTQRSKEKWNSVVAYMQQSDYPLVKCYLQNSNFTF